MPENEIVFRGQISITFGDVNIPAIIPVTYGGSNSLIAVGKGCILYVNGGNDAKQVVSHCCVEAEGWIMVSGANATVGECHVNEKGCLSVVDGAFAYDVTVGGAATFRNAATALRVFVSAGGSAHIENTTIKHLKIIASGTADVVSSGFLDEAIIMRGGCCTISSGCAARRVDVCSGGVLKIRDAAVTELWQDTGGVIDLQGKCKIHYQANSPVGGPEYVDYDSKKEK